MNMVGNYIGRIKHLRKPKKVNWMKNIAVIDIETGGFSKHKNGLCEIGIIIMQEDGAILHEGAWLIKPYERATPYQETFGQLVSYKEDAMAVNGITMEMLNTGDYAIDVANKLNELLQHYQVQIIVGHNAVSFDAPWVEYFMQYFLQTAFKFKQVIDTKTIAQRKYSTLPSHKLQDLCIHFGIIATNKHRALGDCHATRELFLMMTK